jgi:hypothetical protein
MIYGMSKSTNGALENSYGTKAKTWLEMLPDIMSATVGDLIAPLNFSLT